MTYDLVVIGAGAAGSHAALRGRALGLKTMLVESGFLGGTCLNVGCMPTKYRLGGSAPLLTVEAQKKVGVISGELSANLATLQDRKDRYLKGVRSALEKQLLDAGVELVKGRASFTGGHSLKIKGDGERDIEFKRCIVACGSVPATYPGLVPDGAAVLSSTGLLNLRQAPASLIVIGGGVIGLELGDFYSRFGTKITMVEAMSRIALSEDPEVSEALHKHLQREGWEIHVNRKVASITSDNGEALLRFADGEELRAEKAVVAVGRMPNAKQLDAEKAGIKQVGPGWIETNEFLMAAPDIYAVGDVNKRILLSHMAEHQAGYAARHAAGLEKEPYSPGAVPSCIYGHNEVMHVGPHPEEIVKTHKPQGRKVEVSYSQLAVNPIAQSYGATRGWIKITWVDGAIHGVAAWGHNVSRLMAVSTVMVGQHWTGNQIIYAHPTLDEALKMAVLAERKEL